MQHNTIISKLRLVLRKARFVLLSPIALITYFATALACQLVPFYYSLTSETWGDLQGFVIAKPVSLTIDDPQTNLRTVVFDVMKWIGPERSDTMLSLRHYSHQDSLMDYPGLGADCSELIGRDILYLFPVYFRAQWGDTSFAPSFPGVHEILGRKPIAQDSVPYSSVLETILQHFYVERTSPLTLDLAIDDSLFSFSNPPSLNLSVFNNSDSSLPVPPASGFDVNICGFKDGTMILQLFGIQTIEGTRIFRPWSLESPGESMLEASSTANRTINPLDQHNRLLDTLRSTSIDSLCFFVRLNWSFHSYYYLGYSGISSVSDTISLSIDWTTSVPTLSQPVDWRLDQNYPNPFNSSTVINFALARNSRVRLSIYSLLGLEISHFDNTFEPGEHTYEWDASTLPTGVYFYRLRVGNSSTTKRMILLR